MLIDVSISQFRFHVTSCVLTYLGFYFQELQQFLVFCSSSLCCQHLIVGTSYLRAESLGGSWSHLPVASMAGSSLTLSCFSLGSVLTTEAEQTVRSPFGRCETSDPNFKACDVWFLMPSSSLSLLPSLPHTPPFRLLRALFYIWSILAHVNGKVW